MFTTLVMVCLLHFTAGDGAESEYEQDSPEYQAMAARHRLVGSLAGLVRFCDAF